MEKPWQICTFQFSVPTYADQNKTKQNQKQANTLKPLYLHLSFISNYPHDTLCFPQYFIGKSLDQWFLKLGDNVSEALFLFLFF